MNKIIEQLTREFNLRKNQVESTIKLIDEGNTIPFIARYRKEVTGNLDDVTLRELDERLSYLRNLEKRKDEVLRIIETQGKLSEELKKDIMSAAILQEVEDLYLPYKTKRKTRGVIAREKGLEPLAVIIFDQELRDIEILEEAKKFVNSEKEIETPEDAIGKAMDIIAEDISEQAIYRKRIREIVLEYGMLCSNASKKLDTTEITEFEMYYDFTERVNKIANHRVLAINRGEKKNVLTVKIEIDEEKSLGYLSNMILRKNTNKFMIDAVKDAYKRLIYPSIEREVRTFLSEKAEKEAIKVFATNLKNYLLQAPVKNRVVMGFDPAFRTGCKIAVVDEFGDLLDTKTIYPTAPENKVEQSVKILLDLIKKHNITLIAIGNGTASRESEVIIAEFIKKEQLRIEYLVVNEAGASVYSASKIANEEFPDINVSLRGAVSIARRLQDPLAELVKIDPKHIGVGQYQHDVNQKELQSSLDGVIEDVVNSVGVDVNTASVSLLKNISGLNKTTAQNIIEFRRTNGPFKKRDTIKKVKKIGDKAYEQAAGFLRISNGDNPLDNTAVHPESYDVTKKLLNHFNYEVKDIKGKSNEIGKELSNVNIEALSNELSIGNHTLKDIIKEVQKPGRDPRDEFDKPIFKTEVMEIKDLKEGMILSGTVRNVIDFGAFIDIGVHQDGLVHISHLSDKFIKNPMEVVSVGDIVKVKVLSVDIQRNRISLSMKDL
ncbi:S1 RNA-binding domain-containing protein [Alkalibaculum sp. M08DMB]|uniref:S1 RNA-binding domain-containing protein n=1 Tax=Alkalibaculum sporogenes TaxID=2655001 RepID=A0A6A7K610_9FIRM|nr:Tex family protein [Alkalibaculum sporogenes]MPW24860.1 S1 RNA-binding domain-containing protein [Alkalibaculum sporogenes]